jgi:hypothetical protein
VFLYVATRCEVEISFLEKVRSALVVGVAVLGVVFMAHKVRIHFNNLEVVDGARDFVDRIKEHVPPGGRIYQIDGSGFTGYFSERSVVNGDGLTNSYEYVRRMRRGELGTMLDEQGICYIITNSAIRGEYVVNHGGLVVRTGDVVEVFRSKAYGRFATTDFVLFRRKVPSCSPTTVN